MQVAVTKSTKPPLRRTTGSGSTPLLQQPNLDERLRQYSAYELNRKPKKSKSSLTAQKSNQHQIEQHLSSANSTEDSSGSFFLHDPSTVGYNRLSDLFPSCSTAAQTVCSDDSGVGLTGSPPGGQQQQAAGAKPIITRPKSKPPKPPGDDLT